MSGGTISENTAYKGGGVGVGVYASFIMTDGTIGGTQEAVANTAGIGGGVYLGKTNANNTSGSFTMSDDAKILNNKANGGGGVYVESSPFDMSGGTISKNKALYDNSYGPGGGVAVIGTSYGDAYFTMSGGTISENDGLDGAGVYASNGFYTRTTTFDMSDDALITGNTARRNGGGVYYSGGNEYYSSPSSSAVYLNSGGPFTMTGGTIIDNNALDGAGAYINAGVFEMSEDALITDNTATQNGGGVYVAKGANVGQSLDASFYFPVSFTMAGGTIEDNDANDGAGVYVLGGEFEMTSDSAEISSNTAAQSGAGVYVASGATIMAPPWGPDTMDCPASFTMTAGTVQGNTASYGTSSNEGKGGGVYVSGSFTMEDGTISGNNATIDVADEGYGGGVYVETGGAFAMIGGAISANRANPVAPDETHSVSGKGGGVYAETGESFTMTGGTIGGSYDRDYDTGINTATDGNVATHGGGLYIASGAFTMPAGATISGNTAEKRYRGDYGGNGGGVYFAGATFTLNGGTISGNTAEVRMGGHTNDKGGDGGGIYVENGDLTMTVGTINDNASFKNINVAYTNSNDDGGDGGGVYFNGSGGGRFIMTDGEISGNSARVLEGGTFGTAVFGRGGGVYVIHNGVPAADTFAMSGGTIENNYARANNHDTLIKSGGGVYVSGGRMTMSGSASIKGNTGSNRGGGVYFEGGGDFTISESSNVTISDNETGANGGGVFYAGTGSSKFDMKSGSIVRNQTTNKYSSSRGGGVYVHSGTFNMTGTASVGGATLDDKNTAGVGGGVAVEAGAFSMDGQAKITYNDAAYGAGGGLYINVPFTLKSGSIIGNVTANGLSNYNTNPLSGDGGGIYATANAPITMEGGNITRNKAQRSGGGIFAGAGITMTGGTIGGSVEDGNISRDKGGGLYVNGVFNMSAGSAITHNTVIYSLTNTIGGGGVYKAGTGAFTMGGGTISYNSIVDEGTDRGTGTGQNARTFGGGGVYIAGGSFTMSGGTLTENFIHDKRDGEFLADSYSGGGVYFVGTTFTADGATISKNYIKSDYTGATSARNAQYYGGGVYFAGTSASSMINGATISGNYIEYTGSIPADDPRLAYYHANGGGLYKAGTVAFTLDGGTIGGTTGNGNTAKNGGGVYVSAGTFNMNTGAEISSNAAEQDGGGLYYAANTNFTLANGSIIKNTAAGNGGGVYKAGTGVFTLDGGTIGGSNANKNTAKNGGGVYVALGTFTMNTGTTISYNASTGADATDGGGGVYVAAGTFTMDGTATISYNTAVTNGGGVYYAVANQAAKFEMNNGSIIRNTAVNGGGVYKTGASTFTLNGGTIGGSSAAYNTAAKGGGVYVADGVFTMESGSNISYNRSTGSDTANGGGGVYVNTGTFTMNGTAAITNNTATQNGGGLYLNTDFTMTSGTISKNTATQNGGGVYASAGNFTMTGGTIGGTTSIAADANTAKKGGGVYYDGDGTFTISSAALISYNTATGDNDQNSVNNLGGGVYIGGDGTLTMTGGEVSNNKAESTYRGFGGGVYVAGGDFNLSGGTISSNIANHTYNTDQYRGNSGGGGVYIGNGGAFDMTGGTIGGNGTPNTAKGGGGGVYVAGSDFTMSDGTISYNAVTGPGGALGAGAEGGGVRLAGSASFEMSEDAEILYNSAKNGGGVAYADATVSFEMKGGTIKGNTAIRRGGGVYATSAYFTMSGADAEISDNEASGGGGVAAAYFTMTDGDIFDNTANGIYDTYHGGGGVSASEFTMEGGDIYGNTARWNGGGVNAYTTIMTGGTIGGTTAARKNTAENGGGVYIGDTNGASFTMDDADAKIIGNEALTDGGGVYVDGEMTFTMNAGSIGGATAAEGNKAGRNGGGVYVDTTGVDMGQQTTDYGKFTLVGGTITNNTAAQDGGGVYSAGDLTINGGTISENEATQNGGGVYFVESAWDKSTSPYPEPGINYSSFTMTDGAISGNRAIGKDVSDLSAISAIGGDGGGVYVAGGGFYLSGGTISDNDSNAGYLIHILLPGGASGNGGGVYVAEGSYFEISESATVSDNTANNGSGGGVYVAGQFEMQESGIISGNTANTNDYDRGNGGGVYVKNGGSFTMEDGTVIKANKAVSPQYSHIIQGAGGGVYVENGQNFTMNGGTIGGTIGGVNPKADANKTTLFGDDGVVSGSGNGGGLYIASGSFTMSTGTIAYNEAGEGGGVYFFGAGKFTVNGDAKIEYNSSRNRGGGIHFWRGSTSVTTATLEVSGDASISYNDSTPNGGGGGIFVNGHFNLSGGNIEGNAALSQGGGVHFNGGGEFTMSGGTISNNHTVYDGGGVCVLQADFAMEGGEISGNYLDNEYGNGGGVELIGAALNMSGGKISGNLAGESGYGGGVFLTPTTSKAVFTMTGGTIGGTDPSEANTASWGGGVYGQGDVEIKMNAGSPTPTEGTIEGNAATQGGGVYIAYSTNGIRTSLFTMNAGTIKGNTAETDGGGVYLGLEKPVFIMNGGTISDNTADGNDGGGVYVDSTAKFLMTAGTIGDNTATRNGGGVYAANNAYDTGTGLLTSGFEMTGGTIGGKDSSDTEHGNTAGGNGGGVHINAGGEFRLSAADASKPPIISYNTANGGSGNGGGGVFVGQDVNFTMESGTIEGNTAATNGGGVYVRNGGSFTITGEVAITNNTANGTGDGDGGGGIYTEDPTYANIDITAGAEVTFSGNTAVELNKLKYIHKTLSPKGALFAGEVTDISEQDTINALNFGTFGVPDANKYGTWGYTVLEANLRSVFNNYDINYMKAATATLILANRVVDALPDKGKEFTFTLYFKDEGGYPVTDDLTYTGGLVDDAGLDMIGVDKPADGTLTVTDGAATFTLTHGQLIAIEIPVGSVRIVQQTGWPYKTTFYDSARIILPLYENGRDTGPGYRDINVAGYTRRFDFYNGLDTPPPTGLNLGSPRAWLMLALIPAFGLALVRGAVFLRRRARGGGQGGGRDV
jgi:hypothetical protein